MGLYTGKILIDYILLHSIAHFLQALAVFLQQSGAEGFSHSAAQATQSSEQILQSALENDEPLASNFAHKAQMSAQSRQSAIDFKLFLSLRLMQQVAHSSHSMAHARQASMQFLEFSILFSFSFSLQFRCYPAFRFAVVRLLYFFSIKTIPHFGHFPGLSNFTSGCIEQV
jgi:hypothetical protein